MGLLIEGQWKDQWYESSADGAFQREQAQRRHWVTADGAPGPSGEGGFKAEAGRYHLYVSLACPWAHRTLILRKLKGLESLIDVSVVSWLMLENGWTFDKAHGSSGDKLDGLDFMHQRYTADTADYTGRVTVPVLWDKKLKRIVSNESAEIIRMFNSAFNELTGNTLDFYPQALHSTIDSLNERIYHVWKQDGKEVDRIALNINGGRKEGYRAWTHKQVFPSNPVGHWQVRVLTEDGQVIGVLRFEVVDDGQASVAK